MAMTHLSVEGQELMIIVAAALIEKKGRMLLTLRPPGTHLAGHWEFPGGKLESGESPAACLVREIREELGVEVRDPCPLTFAHYLYPGREVLILLYRCSIATQPRPLHAAQLGWFTLDEAGFLKMPPADRPLLEFLASGRR